MNTGGEERARLRILEPAQYAGWITDKDHICRLIEDETSRALTALENADSEITAETLRRTQVRLHRTMLAAKMSKKVPRKLVPLSGALDLSRETFFLLMNSGSGTGAQRRSGLTISPDFTSVSYNSQGGGRSMAIGSRGFTRGVHYWEVSVDAASWGSVFIGVSPGESSSWNGYGLLNYRATQAFGSETLYGSYFAAGDTVGVLLDMDKGTISFFKDGEDFNLGKVVVINMGVAYHNLRRNNRSPCSVLYPCFGIKSSGDQLSLRGSRWVSSKGLGPAALLRHTLEAKHILAHWRDSYSYLLANNISYSSDSNLPLPLSDTVSPSSCYTSPSSLSFSLLHSSELTKQMYNAYLRWRAHDREKVKSRPGLDVAIDTRQEAIISAGGILAAPNGTSYFYLYLSTYLFFIWDFVDLEGSHNL
jgi:SPRY domain-containing SOCS box protein 3